MRQAVWLNKRCLVAYVFCGNFGCIICVVMWLCRDIVWACRYCTGRLYCWGYGCEEWYVVDPALAVSVQEHLGILEWQRLCRRETCLSTALYVSCSFVSLLYKGGGEQTKLWCGRWSKQINIITILPASLLLSPLVTLMVIIMLIMLSASNAYWFTPLQCF